MVFGHGGNGTRATTPLEIASIPASHGLALLCIDNIGHGRGPASTLTLRMTDGSNITVSAPGRGIDQDADGAIGSAEGRYATGPYALAQFADAVTEISADHLSLVRLVEGSMPMVTEPLISTRRASISLASPRAHIPMCRSWCMHRLCAHLSFWSRRAIPSMFAASRAVFDRRWLRISRHERRRSPTRSMAGSLLAASRGRRHFLKRTFHRRMNLQPPTASPARWPSASTRSN